MKKRVFCFIMAAVLTGLSTACASPAAQSPERASDALSSEQVADLSGKYDPAITVKVGLIDDASLTFAGNENRLENSWMDLYREKGIEFDVMFTVASERRGERLSQAIMGGNYPDIFFVEVKDFEDYVRQGVIADITEYYENGYLSETSQNYLNSDNMRSVENATIDGRIYGIPQLSSSYDGVPVLWVRKDWLENLNLNEPETIDDFVNVALAFANNDPDQNGHDDTYGFGLSGAESTQAYARIPHFFNIFGAIPDETTFMEKDGEIIWGGQLEENMIAGLEALNHLYTQGAIPPDFVTVDRAKAEADFTSGKTGMIIAPMWAILGTYGNALDINTEIIALPLPTSEHNQNGSAYLPSATIGFWCASSQFENPEALFKIFNLSTHYIADVQNRTQEEAEKFCVGNSQYTGKALALINYLDDPNNNYNSWKNISAAVSSGDGSSLKADQLVNYESIQFFLDNKSSEAYAALSADDLMRFNTGAGFYSVFGAQDSGYGALDIMIRNGNWFPEAYTSPPTDAMVRNSANLMSFASETLVNIIIGNAQPSSYSDFLNAWEERGGRDVIDSINN